MPGTTPVYGFPYPEPTDLVADYPALGQQLAEDIEAVLPDIGGLAPVAPTSIANSGGSASTTGNTTTFTGVSSISLNGVFSADYDNYRVLITGLSSSTSNVAVNIRFRVSGADNTTSNYYYQTLIANGSSVTASRGAGQTLSVVGYSEGTASSNHVVIELLNPFRTVNKTGHSSWLLATGGPQQGTSGLMFLSGTSFTGFTVLPDSGNITGTAAIYGYKK